VKGWYQPTAMAAHHGFRSEVQVQVIQYGFWIRLQSSLQKFLLITRLFLNSYFEYETCLKIAGAAYCDTARMSSRVLGAEWALLHVHFKTLM